MANNYTKPALRERLKKKIKASSKGGKPGQWSARKSQLLAAEYKKAGGGYKGGKSTAAKKLSKWTSQKWDYVTEGDKDKPKSKRGRYLPKKVRESLTPAQKAAENRKKRAATKKGKTKAAYSKKTAKKVRKA